MATLQSCALDGIELCLDVQMTVNSLKSLRNTRATSEASVTAAIADARKGWASVKRGILAVEQCGFKLVEDRELQDIERNLQTMKVNSQFLDSDGPFVGAQIDRLLRFEVLTSGGRPARE